jgi:purine-binding chemotaxis protein CheW
VSVYATFLVDDRLLGIPVERVQEVLRAQPVTRVPLAHEHVAGLVNLRGQIVTAIDLRARLGRPARVEGQPTAQVVVLTDDGPVSLVVDRLGDVVAVEEDAFETAPGSVDAVARRLIKGTFKLDDALLLDLDLTAVLDLTIDLELV